MKGDTLQEYQLQNHQQKLRSKLKADAEAKQNLSYLIYSRRGTLKPEEEEPIKPKFQLGAINERGTIQQQAEMLTTSEIWLKSDQYSSIMSLKINKWIYS